MYKRKDILANGDFTIFLRLPKNSPELCVNSPDLLGYFELPKGIRDIVYLPNESIMFLCIWEMSVIERPETTMKNTIINPDEITNPLGHTYIYSLEDNRGDFIFMVIWRRKFKPMSCL